MRSPVSWLMLIAAVSLTLWFLTKPPGRNEPETLPQPTGIESPREPRTRVAQIPPPSPDRSTTEPAGESSLPTRLKGEARLKLLSADLHADWKAPMEFYGLLWDDYQRPIPGIKILLSWDEGTPEHHRTTNLVSGADGRFTLPRHQGKTLLVEPSEKEHHVSNATRKRYEFGDPNDSDYHRPHPARPVVFHLRRRQKPQPLLRHHIGLALMGGDRFSIDLQTGKLTPRIGDLSGRYHQSGTTPDGRFEWSLELTAEGIQESTEEFMFLAPAEGYGQTLVLKGVGGGEERNITSSRFYLMSRQGKLFGRVEAMATPGSLNRQGGLTLNCHVNTGGSRELE